MATNILLLPDRNGTMVDGRRKNNRRILWLHNIKSRQKFAVFYWQFARHSRRATCDRQHPLMDVHNKRESYFVSSRAIPNAFLVLIFKFHVLILHKHLRNVLKTRFLYTEFGFLTRFKTQLVSLNRRIDNLDNISTTTFVSVLWTNNSSSNLR